MERVSIGTVESPLDEVDVRRLSEPLGTIDVAINLYRLDPDDALPAGLHTHADQEEVFYVIEGEAEFEMLLPPANSDSEDGIEDYEGDVVQVADSEAIRFAPGDFQSGRNVIDDETVILGLGAPRATDDIRLPTYCASCDAAPVRLDFGGDEPTFQCLDCEAEHAPASCPGCGEPDLRVTLGDETVTEVECPDCGAEYDEPPVRS